MEKASWLMYGAASIFKKEGNCQNSSEISGDASYYVQLGSSEFSFNRIAIDSDRHVVDQHEYRNRPPWKGRERR